MTLVIEYRRDKRDPGPGRTRSIDGEACEYLSKLIVAGRAGVRAIELPLNVGNTMRTSSVPIEHFTTGSEGSGMHRRIRIKAGWEYRLADQDAAAAWHYAIN